MKKKVFLRLRLTGTLGHMAKTLREIKEDIKLMDIVLVILDARLPFSSLNKDVYEIIKAKTVIMVFNKADLANITALNTTVDMINKALSIGK